VVLKIYRYLSVNTRLLAVARRSESSCAQAAEEKQRQNDSP